MDIEMNDTRKKRVRFDVEDSRWDKSFLSLLGDLEENFDEKFVEEDDEEDPIYAIFLDNLKEHGKCYMLDVSVEHEAFTPVIYEVESNPLRKAPRTGQGATTQKARRVNDDNHLKSHRKDSGFLSKVEKKLLNMSKKKTLRTRQHSNIRKEIHVESNRHVKSVLRNSRFVNEVEIDSQGGMSRGHHGYNMRERRGLEADKQLKSAVKNYGFVCKVEKDTLDQFQEDLGVNRELESGWKHSDFVNEVSEIIKKKRSRTSLGNNMRENVDLQVNGNAKSGCGFQGKRPREVDETYNAFFAGLNVVGDSMVFKFGDRRQVFYEENIQQMSTDDENLAEPMATPRPVEKPMTTQKPAEEPITTQIVNRKKPDTSVTDKTVDIKGKDSQKDHSRLWKELCGILGKPYDKNEFDDLWEKMNRRSQVQNHRDSRSGGTCRLGNMGNSYIDSYPDLKAEIEKVRSDSCKVLKLLRMLCFYLMYE